MASLALRCGAGGRRWFASGRPDLRKLSLHSLDLRPDLRQRLVLQRPLSDLFSVDQQAMQLCNTQGRLDGRARLAVR